MTTHITSSAQWGQILKSSTVVVTDFYAEWCGPCKVIAPTFESLATKYAKPGRITFAKVDVDKQSDVASQYGVRAMPTFLILRNGTVIETIQGANAAALTAAVDKAVKLANVPGAAFSTPGRTLGGSSGSGGSPRRGSSFDLNRFINNLVTFFGLYLVSLFSLDPYMAAQKSKFNIRNPTVPINLTGSAPINTGSSTSSAPRRPQPKQTFKTLADLE